MSGFSFDFTFSYYPISALINVLTSLILGTFVYLQNRKEPINLGFGLFGWSVAAWSLGYFFWQISTTVESALFWSRALMIGAIFTPITFLQFVFGLLEVSKGKKKFLLWSYALFSIFVLFSFNSLFVNRVEPALSFPFWPKPGPVFHPFLAIWFSYLVYAVYLLARSYKKTFGIQRAQIKYVLAAMIIAFASGSTNYFLWYNILIPPFANIFVSVYVILITYAVLKHHLFNIRVIATELLVAAIAVLLYLNIFASKTPFEYAWKGGLLIAFLWAGYLLIKSVLTEIKQREQLQEAYKKLEELDRSKSEFVSIASHQLRTPLTAMKGYISMMLEGSYGTLDTKQKKPIESVYESSERLIRLVNDLLNVSRIEAGKIEMKWEQGSVEDIIKSIIQELAIKTRERNVELVFKEPESSLPLIRIDKEKIRNVVFNILDNAIRYTPHGKITLSAVAQQQNVLIRIQDTGEGMSKEEISKLFQTFSRGGAGMKFSTEGAGLGLYIAKKFLEMHKGKIWAESAGKGQGSTFFVELPVA